MKELTSAQGLLRCGECSTTFDGMKSLSTTLPDDRKFAENNKNNSNEEDKPRRKVSLSPLALAKKSDSQNPNRFQNQKNGTHKSHSTKFLLIALISLTLLLMTQILYKQKDWLADQPLTANATRAFCNAIGCEVKVRRDIQKIEMLNRNVYSHPNEPGALVITASINNKADFAQPYPLIEVSFLNNKSQIIALRRFTPAEYVKRSSDKMEMKNETMKPNKPVDFKLKIADPGKDAVRFQFRFL